MVLLHHIYNYLQSNLTIPKVHEIVQTPILNDLQEVKKEKEKEKEKVKEITQDKDELKAYLNQFKKK
jgi:hypothetical protein